MVTLRPAQSFLPEKAHRVTCLDAGHIVGPDVGKNGQLNRCTHKQSAPPEPLAGWPPALLQMAGAEVLTDEGVAYARKLNEAGVETILTCYDGLMHDDDPRQRLPVVGGR